MTDRPPEEARERLVASVVGGPLAGLAAMRAAAAAAGVDLHSVAVAAPEPPPALPILGDKHELLSGDPRPTDQRQSLRAIEILLPRALYDRLERLRVKHAPGLTLPDFCAHILGPGVDGFEAVMGDLDRAGRLVIEP